MDTKGIDPRIILSERFRSAQEVMDHGFQIVGSGITFPGDGVKFTGAAGQRLTIAMSPSSSLYLDACSVHTAFSPNFPFDSDPTQRRLWAQDTNHGFLTIVPTDKIYICFPNSNAIGLSVPYNSWVAVMRQGQKNYLSYSLKNGEQTAWLNGVQVSVQTNNNITPTSPVARTLHIGCNASEGAYNCNFIGTIHHISWYSKTMTIEDHLDFMHNDTYSEIF